MQAPLFKQLSRYLARKPSMDPRLLPLLYRLGTAANRTQLGEQAWLVRLLLAGVRVSTTNRSNVAPSCLFRNQPRYHA